MNPSTPKAQKKPKAKQQRTPKSLAKQNASTHQSFTQEESVLDAQANGTQSAPEKVTKKKKQGNPKNPQSHQAQTPAKNYTPRPENNKHSSTGKVNGSGTPVNQAYAGPTFHASPAASSLPMPKFFQKALANRPVQPVPENAISDSTSAGSSEKSEDSPTLCSLIQTSDTPVNGRQSTPLDLFFNADRQERASRSMSNATQELSSTMMQVTEPPMNRHLGTKSGSEQFPQSQHQRANSEQTHNGYTSSGAQTPRSSYSAVNGFTLHTSEALRSSTSLLTPLSDAEEERRRKSIALKQLLKGQSPQSTPQSSNGLTQNAPISPYQAPLSPSPSPRPQILTRSTSGPNVSRLGRDGTLEETSTPIQQSQSNTRRYGARSDSRPLSSHLRHSMSHDDTDLDSFASELPASPTPFRNRQPFSPTSSSTDYRQNQHNNLSMMPPISPRTPGYPPQPPHDNQRSSPMLPTFSRATGNSPQPHPGFQQQRPFQAYNQQHTQRPSSFQEGAVPLPSQGQEQPDRQRALSSNELMEDALRKILKIDGFRTDGSAGVRP
ncbi:hypothetical protein MMC25_001249 [Agyrium rufum]|nr:hypothetical protein [Agyrium rufum]